MMTLSDRVQGLTSWIDQNPLRQWRNAQDGTMGIRTVAGLLQVNPSTITAWESGAARPSEPRMDALCTLTSRADLAAAWDAWLTQRPKVVA